jgi:hypothetical protein
MTAYAENLVAASELRKKRGTLTSSQAGRMTPHRYQATRDERVIANLSKSVSDACDRFFLRRGLGVGIRSWGFRGVK